MGSGFGYRNLFLIAGQIRRRVLVCDGLVPAADRDAGSQRMVWILRLLRTLGCQVTLVALWGRAEEPYTSELRLAGVEVIASPNSFQEFARTRAGLYDTVILCRPRVAATLLPEIRRMFRTARILYDTVDLHFLREARGRAFVRAGGLRARLQSLKRRRVELSCIRRSDVTLAVSEIEASVIRRYVPGAATAVIPTVHVADSLPAMAFDERRDLLFIGGFHHSPNVDAVQFFVTQVFPAVLERLDIRLTLLGSDPPETIRALSSSRISVTGYLADVGAYFRTARVFVCPLRYGAGMKGKNGQAMSFGLPIVTTTVGAEGMDLVDGTDALIRDDPAAFATAVVELYTRRELWETISRNSRAVVEERWGPGAMRQRLEHLLCIDPREPGLVRSSQAQKGVGETA
jgi:glycosyltransferase involved in cell wall biosynthesis